jgi:hypothetical protein
MIIGLIALLKDIEKWYWFFAGLRSSILVLWRWPGKTAEHSFYLDPACRQAGFFATFFYQEKKVE